MLGLVYDRVRDIGDMLRVIGDTTGGLAGGSIKLLSASVNVRVCTEFAFFSQHFMMRDVVTSRQSLKVEDPPIYDNRHISPKFGYGSAANFSLGVSTC